MKRHHLRIFTIVVCLGPALNRLVLADDIDWSKARVRPESAERGFVVPREYRENKAYSHPDGNSVDSSPVSFEFRRKYPQQCVDCLPPLEVLQSHRDCWRTLLYMLSGSRVLIRTGDEIPGAGAVLNYEVDGPVLSRDGRRLWLMDLGYSGGGLKQVVPGSCRVFELSRNPWTGRITSGRLII